MSKTEPTSTNTSAVTQALINVQSLVKPIKPSGESHHGDFITLKQIYDHLKPLWKQEGLAVWQRPISSSAGSCTVQTVICHAESGEQILSEITIPMQRHNDPQAYGAAMTYGCRYSLKCIFGIVEEGDDDNADSSSMTLEKLLREIGNASDYEEAHNIRAQHLERGYLSDKFWARVYDLVYKAKLAAVQGFSQAA